MAIVHPQIYSTIKMSGNTRITWIDLTKAFSIMAVVLYHTNIQSDIKDIAYLVCLPAFFFAAGLFAKTNLSPAVFFHKVANPQSGRIQGDSLQQRF